MFQYYIKIVPTMFVKLDGTVLLTNQFSVTRHQKAVSIITGESGMPGAFFNYELSPLMVKYTEKERYKNHTTYILALIISYIALIIFLADLMSQSMTKYFVPYFTK